MTRTVLEGVLERGRGGEQRAAPQRPGVQCSGGPTLELGLGDPKSAPPLASCVAHFLICEQEDNGIYLLGSLS